MALYESDYYGGWSAILPPGDYNCAAIVKAGGKCNGMSTLSIFKVKNGDLTDCQAEFCLDDDFGRCA